MMSVSALIDFLMNLMRDEDAKAEFDEDPQGSLTRAGLDGVSGQDVRDARLIMADDGGLRPKSGHTSGSNSRGDDPVREIHHTTTNYVVNESPTVGDVTVINIDDRDTTVIDSFNSADTTDVDVVAVQDNSTDIDVTDIDVTDIDIEDSSDDEESEEDEPAEDEPGDEASGEQPEDGVDPADGTPGDEPSGKPADGDPVDGDPAGGVHVDDLVDSDPTGTGPIDSGPVDTGPIDTGPVATDLVDSPVDSEPISSEPIDTQSAVDEPDFDTAVI